MKKIILFAILIINLSCSKTKSIILKTENAEGISNETKLKINGIEIGEIENTKLDENGNVIITANLKSDLNIPIDSDFEIKDEGLISGKIINITIGKSKENITEKSIINLKTVNNTIFNDSIGTKIQKALNQISGKDKNDSILIELRRLNENLEKRK
ncbi:MlaD family protein [Flavobacterium urocaniciphilum]|uniref:MlaD protein n=1 Tax=Flavobacterium urocaniciphilum TaxID=1299341 RepID=A0A1H9D3L6_9FLAO|nr:MCE family protein [Flavobacterium urocaniciphilum]SEQ08086.1 MlaD protein [Flavobacterium urocaniciphilum]